MLPDNKPRVFCFSLTFFFFSFFTDDSSSQQHLSHTNVLVLQESGSNWPVPGGWCCRSGGEDQAAHGKWPRKQRGLGHSEGIREWPPHGSLPELHITQMRKSVCGLILLRFCIEGRWLLKTWEFGLVVCSDGPDAVCQQDRLRVPQRERRLWLR